MNFLEQNELKEANEFLKKGFVIKNVNDLSNLNFIRGLVLNRLKKIIKNKNFKIRKSSLDDFHKYINVHELNDIRLDLISHLNSSEKFKETYFQIAKQLLFNIVGNELAMQNKINLSIQLPKDDSSLLPVHSDIWSGDSPYEVVVWMPLVDCYKTKTMYLLPPNKYRKIHANFKKYSEKDSETFFKKIKKDLIWINIKYGQIMLFNQALPHGNVVNNETETRWSFNCRFKSLYSPYGDKKIGEFFQPITIRPASQIGMSYSLPKIK